MIQPIPDNSLIAKGEIVTNSQVGTKSSNKATYVLIFILVLVLISTITVVSILLLNRNTQSQQIIPISTTVPTQTSIPTIIAPSAANPIKNFTSSVYKVSFNYPSSLGNATAIQDKNYPNNEEVTFENSNLFVSYWVFEGGDVCDEGEKDEELLSKDGKTCVIYCADDKQDYSYAQCWDPASSYTVTFITMAGLPDKKINVNKDMLKGMISTLSFDSSDVQLKYEE
jgi:hypothetical protein